MTDKQMLALVASLMRDARALKAHGQKATVEMLAAEAAAKAEERARSQKVLARVEEAMNAERGNYSVVPFEGQRGNLKAGRFESQYSALRDHVKAQGVKRGSDSKRETVRYDSRDMTEFNSDRPRDPLAQNEMSDETAMRRIDSLAAKSAKVASRRG